MCVCVCIHNLSKLREIEDRFKGAMIKWYQEMFDDGSGFGTSG